MVGHADDRRRGIRHVLIHDVARARAMGVSPGGGIFIHGTPQPWSIGTSASSGCVRMVTAHVIDLYDSVSVGSTAFLYPTA